MKLIFKIIFLSFFAAIGFFLWANFWRDPSPQEADEKLVSLSMDGQSFNIQIRRREKEAFKELAQKVKALIYREATEHNPPGDLVPDSLDDKVVDKVKEKIN